MPENKLAPQNIRNSPLLQKRVTLCSLADLHALTTSLMAEGHGETTVFIRSVSDSMNQFRIDYAELEDGQQGIVLVGY